MNQNQPLRVGIGGPVGSGKTALTLALCKRLRDRYQLGVVTNDIYTEEDAQFLVRNEALVPDHFYGGLGALPHQFIGIEQAACQPLALEFTARAHTGRKPKPRRVAGIAVDRVV